MFCVSKKQPTKIAQATIKKLTLYVQQQTFWCKKKKNKKRTEKTAIFICTFCFVHKKIAISAFFFLLIFVSKKHNKKKTKDTANCRSRKKTTKNQKNIRNHLIIRFSGKFFFTKLALIRTI